MLQQAVEIRLGERENKAKSTEKAQFTEVNEHIEFYFNAVSCRLSRNSTAC